MATENPNHLVFSPTKILDFNLQPDLPANRNFSITNNSDKFFAFKVKTTTPNKYLVHPCIGTIGPEEKFIIKIKLHPQSREDLARYNFTLNEENSAIYINTSDKFQVLSVALDEDVSIEALAEFWRRRPIEKGHRLSVVYRLSTCFKNIFQGNRNYVTSQNLLPTGYQGQNTFYHTEGTLRTDSGPSYGSTATENAFPYSSNQFNNTSHDELIQKYKESVSNVIRLESDAQNYQLEIKQLKSKLEKEISSKKSLKFLLTNPYFVIISIIAFIFFSNPIRSLLN